MNSGNASVCNLLSRLRSYDNKVRGGAEEELAAAVKRNPDSTFKALAQAGVDTNLTPEDREFAIICINQKLKDLKRLGRKGKKSIIITITDQQLTELKGTMISLLQSKELSIQARASEAIASLCQYILFIEKGWPEIPQIILSLIHNPSTRMQVMGANIINSLINSDTKTLHLILDELLKIIDMSLSDPNSSKVVSFECRTKLFEAVSQLIIEETKNGPFFAKIAKAFGAVWGLIRGALEAGLAETVSSLLSCVSTVVQERYKAVKNELLNGFTVIADITISESIPDFIRRTALSLYLLYCKVFYKEFNRVFTNEMAIQVLFVICKWMCDFPDDPDWEKRPDETPYNVQQPLVSVENDRECEDATVDITKAAGENDIDYHVGIAENAADSLAMSLGRRILNPLLQELVPKLIISPDWKVRHVACILIALAAEGMYKDPSMENVEMDIEPYVKWIASLYRDPHPRVRWAVSQALGLLCTDYEPALQNKCHELVALVLHSLVKDQVIRVRSHSTAALTNFYNTGSVSVIRYHKETIQLLVGLMQSSDLSCQKRAVNCLTSIARLCGSMFNTYYSTFMPIILNQVEMILKKGKQDKPTTPNGRTFLQLLFEAITIFGYSVGPANFMEDGIRFLSMLLQYKLLDGDASNPLYETVHATDFLKNIKLILFVLKGLLHPDQVFHITEMCIRNINRLLKILSEADDDEDFPDGDDVDDGLGYGTGGVDGDGDNYDGVGDWDDGDVDKFGGNMGRHMMSLDEINMYFTIVKIMVKNTPGVLFFFGEELLNLLSAGLKPQEGDEEVDILMLNSNVVENVCECATTIAHALNKACFNEMGPNGVTINRVAYYTFLVKKVSSVLLKYIGEFGSEYETLILMIKNISLTYYHALKWTVLLAPGSQPSSERFAVIDNTVCEMLDPLIEALSESDMSIKQIAEDNEDEFSEDFTARELANYNDLIKEVARYLVGEGFSCLGDAFTPVFNKKLKPIVETWMVVERGRDNTVLLDRRVGGIMAVMGMIKYDRGGGLDGFITSIMRMALGYLNDPEAEPDLIQGCFYSFRLLFVCRPLIGKQLISTYPNIVMNWTQSLSSNPKRKYLEDSYENAISSLLHMVDVYQQEFMSNGTIQQLWKFVLMNVINFKQDLEEIEDCLLMICKHLNMNDRYMCGDNNDNMALIVKALVMLIANNDTRYSLKKSTIATVLGALKIIYTADKPFFMSVVYGIDNPIVLADLEQIMK